VLLLDLVFLELLFEVILLPVKRLNLSVARLFCALVLVHLVQVLLALPLFVNSLLNTIEVVTLSQLRCLLVEQGV
jgi:hypothetical protein